MSLFVRQHPLGVVVYTKLSAKEKSAIGNDVSELLLPGESFGGLGFDELERIARGNGEVSPSSLCNKEEE
jgi:hypothetical protein